MHSTTVAVDLQRTSSSSPLADSEGNIGERLRLNRARFSSFFVHRAPCRVLMEACGSAHYWARWIGAHGHAVQLLPRSTCASTLGAIRLTARTPRR